MICRPSVLLSLALALGPTACGDGGGPPAVDVTGVWIGTYTAQSGEAGPILLDFTQSSSGELSGGLEVLGQAIAHGNSGVSIEGVVHGHQLSLTVSGAEDRVTATESSGTLEGTIVSGMTASFRAARVPTQTMRVAATRPAGGQIPRLLAAQGGALWVYDWYDNSIKKTDDTGGVTVTINLETIGRCEGGFDGCGDSLVCSYGTKLIRVDPASSRVTSLDLPAGLHAGGVACGSSSLWVDQGTTEPRNIQELSRTPLSPRGDGFHLPGILTDLAFDGTDLWALEFFPRVLLRVSTASGAILAAYQIPEARSKATLTGLTWDGSALWSLLTSYGEGPQTVAAVKLVVGGP